MEPDTQQFIGDHYFSILRLLGYATEDQHFRRTPDRVASMLMEYHANAGRGGAEKLLEVQFNEELEISSLILVGPVSYTSMCAHHLALVSGKAWVGYIPDKRICGLSKLSRLVTYYAKQLTVQERVTEQIADTLFGCLDPKGCMVVISARHSCMSARGVNEREAMTTTSAVRGLHKDSNAARNEFLSLMEGR